jgi:hypothetical protein
MGDRTNVSLIVLTEQEDLARELGADDACSEYQDVDLGVTIFEFEEVNYATLDFEDDLTDAGIAWTKEWGAGGLDDVAGVAHVRFTEAGDLQCIEVYDGGENPPIADLLALCSQPDKLVQFIRTYYKDHTPLPWDHQAGYGRRYMENQK